ncbi:MAG TPA: NADH-quinone oxidoreductase subunit J [Anaeromyxobacteraceae bacterium]|nr:NADH-quinone oxidoreductase subunit J [Anaeromyxobacteraceae bacterium]
MVDRAEGVVFLIFAIPLIVTAFGVIWAKNPVNAAISLVAAFFFLAGIYVLLLGHLIAFLQVLVYAGAIMVLFLFVIMLLTTGDDDFGRARLKVMQVGGILGAAGVLAVITIAAAHLHGAPFPVVPAEFGTVKAVGRLIFTQFLLPFEVTSLLLLVAIVGAVVVAKQRI